MQKEMLDEMTISQHFKREYCIFTQTLDVTIDQIRNVFSRK